MVYFKLDYGYWLGYCSLINDFIVAQGWVMKVMWRMEINWVVGGGDRMEEIESEESSLYSLHPATTEGEAGNGNLNKRCQSLCDLFVYCGE